MSLSTTTCLNSALNCWGTGLSLNPSPSSSIIDNKFSRQSWFSILVNRFLKPQVCNSSHKPKRAFIEIYQPFTHNHVLHCSVLIFEMTFRHIFKNFICQVLVWKGFCTFVMLNMEWIKQLIKCFQKFCYTRHLLVKKIQICKCIYASCKWMSK